MSKPKNTSVFPQLTWECPQGETTAFHFTRGGLSKRELFAAMALQGLLANPGGPIQANGMNGWSLCNCSEEDVAKTALSLADALIAALNKEPTP